MKNYYLHKYQLVSIQHKPFKPYIMASCCEEDPCPPNSLIEACQSERHTLDLKCANVLFLMNFMLMQWQEFVDTLLLAKSFHFSNMVDYFLCLMLYYERLQTSIRPSWSWHGFMATCLWSWIPLWTMLNQIVGIGHTWNLEKVIFRTRNPHAQGGKFPMASGE